VKGSIIEVLRLIDGNGTTFAKAAETLQLSIEELGNRVRTLEDMGCLKEEGTAAEVDHEATKRTGCLFCPLAEMCKTKERESCDIRMGRVYTITEKGKRLLEESG